MTRTWPTPSELSSCRRSTLSAYSVISRSGFCAVTATVRTGEAVGSSFSTVGWITVRGRSGITRLILSRTSCAATFASFSRTKATITCDTPSDEFDVSVSMPLMVFTASSILSVTSVSICSGAAPSRRVVIATDGMSTLGKRSTPRRVNANSPTTTSERIRTQAKTGRLTQSSASHCMTSAPDLHAGVVLETLEAACDDPIVHAESGRRLDLIAFRLSNRDQPFLDVIADDDEDAIGVGRPLHGGRRNQQRGRLGGLLDVCGGEEPGLQPAVVVGDNRFDHERARFRAEAGRDEADLADEGFTRKGVDLQIDGAADGDCRHILCRHGELESQRADPHHRRDLRPSGDVVADRHEALGDDAVEGRAHHGVGDRLSRHRDPRLGAHERLILLLGGVLRDLVLPPCGFELRLPLIELGLRHELPLLQHLGPGKLGLRQL